MREAVSNWDRRCIPVSFPYLRVLMRGRPGHGEDDFSRRHPQMNREHRARIFAPFDALDGFMDLVHEKDRLREEAAEKTEPGNILEEL